MRGAGPSVRISRARLADRTLLLRRGGLRLLAAAAALAPVHRVVPRRGHHPPRRLIDRPGSAPRRAGPLLHLLPQPVHRYARPLPATGVVGMALGVPRLCAASAEGVAEPDLAQCRRARPQADARLQQVGRCQQGALRPRDPAGRLAPPPPAVSSSGGAWGPAACPPPVRRAPGPRSSTRAPAPPTGPRAPPVPSAPRSMPGRPPCRAPATPPPR